jgi:uncharacterized membrane protein YfcA
MESSQRLYLVRRPVAAFCAGAAVAILGGMIGLGGAEFRLPLLIAIFDLYPQRAVRINLLISLATLAASAAARLSLVHATNVSGYAVEISGMVAGGIAMAWIGAGILSRIPKIKITPIIAGLLIVVAVLIVVETVFSGTSGLTLPHDQALRAIAAILAGTIVGAVSSLLGVAGGELIIPILIFVFGADIRTAGTASVLIGIPIVVTGVVRHILTGHFRSRSMLGYLVLPMSAGSILGAISGGYLAAWSPTILLRVIFAVILAVSAVKLLATAKSQH